MYSVESAFAQNFPSWSSVLKLGILFFTVGIDRSFIPVHVTRRDDSNEVPANGKGKKQPAVRAGLTESVITFLNLRMRRVASNNQGLVKEHALPFLGRHPMPLPVLVDVVIVPVETCAALQGIRGGHKSSIQSAYTFFRLDSRYVSSVGLPYFAACGGLSRTT